MNTKEHILWHNFRDQVLAAGDPAKLPLTGAVDGEIFVEEGARLIGIRLADPTPDFPGCHDSLREMQIRRVYRHGRDWAEIACDSAELFESFYAFMLHLADVVQVEQRDICTALSICLDDFERLVRRQKEMSGQEVIGLWGELWFLRELVRVLGAQAVDAWKGPAGHVHDFLVGDLEVEIKTTVRSARQHVIHGLTQLTASPGKRLFLVSVHAEEAGFGHGKAVSELIEDIEEMVAGGAALEAFRSLLASLGFDWSLGVFRKQRWDHREEPRLIPVDKSFPRITQQLLSANLGQRAQRISAVEYCVDVTDLGQTLVLPDLVNKT